MNQSMIVFLSACLATSSVVSAEVPPAGRLRSPAAADLPHAPSTAEQRQRIIEITRALEKMPFGEIAHADREWALSLIDHAPDIFPSIHGPVTFDITENTVPDRRAIFAQFVFGFVSFQLSNPDRADDVVEVYQAGFTSCLRVYRRSLGRDAANRIDFLDVLNKHEREGKLRQYVELLTESVRRRLTE